MRVRVSVPDAAGLVLLVAVALLPFMPVLMAFPYTDSGVFIYTGQRILAGDVPYRDVWDHKPPGIHYLNALAWALGGETRWGIWLAEVASLSVAMLVAYRLMRQAFGRRSALWAVLLVISTLPVVLKGGNIPEEFTLPLQVGALALALRPGEPPTFRRAGVIGFLGGLAFLFRQNIIGLWLVLAGLWLWDGWRADRWRAVGRVTSMGAGALSVIGLVALYFATQGALDELWDAAFRFNFAYSTVTWRQHVAGWLGGWLVALETGLLGPLVSGWLLGVLALRRSTDLSPLQVRLIRLAVVGLPVETLFTSVSGRVYPYYYIVWLPTVVILLALFAWLLAGVVARLGARVPRSRRRWFTARLWLALLSVLLVWSTLVTWTNMAIPKLARWLAQGEVTPLPALDYVREHTEPDDLVLVWGSELWLNALAERRAPTRLIYHHPLYQQGYARPELVAELLADLQAEPPALIFDASNANMRILSLDPEWRQARMAEQPDKSWADLSAIYEFVAQHYRFVTFVEHGTNWRVYAYVEPAATP